MPRHSDFLLSVALALTLSACGGNSSPVDPGDGGRPVIADPSFANDVYPIFIRNGCAASGCHGTGQAGLALSSPDDAYAHLASVSSTETGEIRVIPGDAANSYLVKKLEGRAAVGARMPLGRAPLGTTDLQNIKNWIDRGALNN